MNQFEIVFYEDKNGNSPFLDFFDDLKKEKEKGKKNSRILFNSIARRLTYLKAIGTRKGMPDFRKIKGSRYNLWEIRIKHQKGAFRILICNWATNKYVVLNHFFKKQNRTPKNEIEKAERWMDDFLAIKEGERNENMGRI